MITQDRLKELFNYNQETGEFTWKNPPYKNKNFILGGKAGSLKHTGYVQISINSKFYQAHRLAWVYVYGEIANTLMIDHINGIKSDNRISNLRLATRQQNLSNRGKTSHNTSGFKGVSWNCKMCKWVASITKNNRKTYLGAFNTTKEAGDAYALAVSKFHGEFANAVGF